MINHNKCNCKKGFHKFINIKCSCGHKHCKDCGVCQCLNTSEHSYTHIQGVRTR